MNKKILIIILIIVGLGLIIIGKKLPSASNNAINENLNSITASTTTDNTKITSYTMTDVAKNNTESSCWSAVSGKVYNLTAWISKHPGGAKNIIKICGIDGSNFFNGKHGGQARPASELVNFYIGDLVK